MEEGIAKEIPIIGTVIGFGKAAMGIKEILFLKKIIYFISELKNISATKRHEMIDKIDNSGKFRTKVGEKLLYIIDKCDDHEKSQITARLFSAFLSEIISYEEFLRASYIVDQVILEDLKRFVECGWEEEDGWKYRNEERDDHLTLDEAGNIATSGLVELVSPEVMVRDQDDWKMSEKYIVEGSELTVRITDIGKKIREILKGSLN
ncbi:MAG: hypothetical protein KKC23_05425 [Proteobacteria bacterium]|nr:hypothetical protein [Pseudomonadota bacterium]